MNFVTILIDLLDKLLEVLLSEKRKKEQADVKEAQAKTEASIRRNPRDYFDDGVLNDSTGPKVSGNNDSTGTKNPKD